MPRELRFDRNGYPLPPGAIARLGIPPAVMSFAWTLAWTAAGKQFVKSHEPRGTIGTRGLSLR